MMRLKRRLRVDRLACRGMLGCRRAAAGSLLLLLVACSGGTQSTDLAERRLYAMGTWVDIAIDAPQATAEAVFAEAESFLRRFEVDYYAWADGELARLNAALGAGEGATVSPELAALIAEARRLSELSGGTFDPAVGSLVELWGFHSALVEPQGEPAPAAIEAWRRAAPSIRAVGVDGRRVAASVPGVLLDLGGIAKGEAVDRIVALLRSRGVASAMVNAGGDLRVIGRRGGRPWRIGIQDPRADAVLAVLELDDGEAAFTSGDYERYVERDGRRLHHILDPRTGYPAKDTRAVTVVAGTGVHADAAATALFVGGDDWPRIARDLGIDAALRVDSAGAVEVSPAMQRRLIRTLAEKIDVVADS